MSRVAINKDLIRWAVDRSAQDEAALVGRFPKLPQWEAGEVQPTFKQLEDFAKATLTPFGAFFLSAPPLERMPVPDFRTMRDQHPRRPSAALLETIYQMQRRRGRKNAPKGVNVAWAKSSNCLNVGCTSPASHCGSLGNRSTKAASSWPERSTAQRIRSLLMAARLRLETLL